MPRLVSISQSDGGKLIFGLALEEGESREVLSKQISEQGIPWDDVEPESAGLAIRLQLHLEQDDPPPMEVRIIDDESPGDEEDDAADPDEREAKRARTTGGGGSGASIPLHPSMDDYFLAYEDLSVHELMIRDAPRMEAYRKALIANRCLCPEKHVSWYPLCFISVWFFASVHTALCTLTSFTPVSRIHPFMERKWPNHACLQYAPHHIVHSCIGFFEFLSTCVPHFPSQSQTRHACPCITLAAQCLRWDAA
jgi:hypothetical protein